MNFLVDINPNKELPKYSMILCKLNEEQIMTITNISNLEYKGEFINIDELSFEIPLYRTEADGTQIKNERYDAIKGDMLILLNKTKFFYIHYAKEKVNGDGSTYKEVQAYSREFELSNKIISGYSGVSRKIYDYTNQKDENNLEIGYFNYIEKISSWRISYISPNVLTKFRALDFPNTNVLQSFQEVQQTFGCLLQFNTLDKTIDIYEADQLGTNQGLRITDRNFLQSLEKTIKSNEIKTRLFLYGRDNISIQKLSITGKPYIENYDFFKTTEYMSQGLIDALDNYDAYLLTKQGLFDGYLTQLNTKNAELGNKNDELVALQTELKVIQSNLDVAISSGQPTSTFKTQETNKLAEISTKLSQILTLQNEIDAIEGNINSIAIDTDMTKHFTEAQARELDSFIREDTFTDSNYTEDNLDELLLEGQKILSRISQPAIQFNVSVVDFLSVVESQHEWSKFVLGDKVNLYHRDLNFDYEVRLVGYTHNPDNNSLDLKFSNTNTIDDANLYLRDLLADLKTTSTSVDFSRFKWDKGENANSMISNYINSNLDLEKQKIMGASSQKPLVDERGIWLVKENPDGSIDPKQMRLINNALVISADNWVGTPEVAISAEKGINAALIQGKIGQFAELDAGQITVGSEEQALLDYINEQNQAITVHQILLDNENQSIVTDYTGKVTNETIVQSSIDVYRGITKVDGIIGTPILKDKDGNAITYGTITKTDPTSTTSGSITWIIPTNINISSDSGYIEIPLTIEGKEYTKKLFWSKAKEGQKGADGAQGQDGVAGTDAKLVIITPSHSSFISESTGTDINTYVYTPTTLTLTPQFQNCTYSKWQYSLNGTTWVDVISGQNGLTITGNVLSIASNSALYNANQTQILFRVLSDEVNVFDLITIARLYNPVKLAGEVGNSIKQDIFYNRTKITSAEGIEVFDGLGNQVLQMGSIDANNDGTKDSYGFVAKHSDGTYSSMTPSGFLKKYLHGQAGYLNDIWVETFTTQDGNSYTQPPPANRIYIPQSFRGRGATTKIVLMLSGLSSTQMGDATRTSSTNIRVKWFARWLEIYLDIVSMDFNAANPYIDIKPYSLVSGPLADGTTKTYADDYRRVSFTIILIGT